MLGLWGSWPQIGKCSQENIWIVFPEDKHMVKQVLKYYTQNLGIGGWLAGLTSPLFLLDNCVNKDWSFSVWDSVSHLQNGQRSLYLIIVLWQQVPCTAHHLTHLIIIKMEQGSVCRDAAFTVVAQRTDCICALPAQAQATQCRAQDCCLVLRIGLLKTLAELWQS